MLVTDDTELARRARLLRSHGLSVDTWSRHYGHASGYEVLEPGFNYRLDEARAALGLLLLRRLGRDNERRGTLAARYRAELGRIDGVRPVLEPEPDTDSAWHIYPLLLDPGVDREAFRSRLAAAGVQTSVHYPPLHLMRAFINSRASRLTVTEDYARRTVTVPLFPHMSEDQQAHVIDSIAKAFGP
jgi:dTDP-4-amino-4,6-dideoxygalactose transaminase